MTTAAVFEYSPALLAKIHPLFSLWPLVWLSFKMNRDRQREREKNTSLIHPKMSGVLPPFSTQSVCLPHLAETQRAMHFENHNHLAVGFCDTLQPRWWMSHRIRKMTDVIWISYATLTEKKSPRHCRRCLTFQKQVWFVVRGDDESDFLLFDCLFNQLAQRETCCQLARERECEGGVRFKSLTDSDLIEISEVNSNDEV